MFYFSFPLRSYLNFFVLFSRPLKGIFLYDQSSGDFRMSDFGRRESKFQVQSQQTATVLKMKDPLSTCCVSIAFKTCFISQNTLDHNINMNPTAREGSWNSFCGIMTWRLLCLSVQPTLSKCETSFKNRRILLQRTYDGVSTKVVWIRLQPGDQLLLDWFFSYWLTMCRFLLLFQGWAGVYLF